MLAIAQRASSLALRNAPLLLLAAVVLTFGLLTDTFLSGSTLVNILVQSSSVGIVAVGMTVVLLTGGIDLSVGAIMFLSAAIAGKMVLADNPIPLALALLVIVLVGMIYGSVNALFITRLGMLPFIVTLATLYAGRGFGLWLTETRAMNLPPGFLQIGQSQPIPGIPFPILIFASVVLVGHAVLMYTSFGRQIYALGADPEAARKAGINTRRLLAVVYIISGLCAAIGGIVSVAQLGAVSPKLGDQREFAAIAAAVLGGTSLFGGRGSVFPGTVLGAVLIQTIESGLIHLNPDPYIYPIVISAVIFSAVLLDRARHLLHPTP